MDPRTQLMPPYPCFVGGANAPFSFTTRTGDIWTCLNHTSEGKRRFVAPGLAKPDRIGANRGASNPSVVS